MGKIYLGPKENTEIANTPVEEISSPLFVYDNSAILLQNRISELEYQLQRTQIQFVERIKEVEVIKEIKVIEEKIIEIPIEIIKEVIKKEFIEIPKYIEVLKDRIIEKEVEVIKEIEKEIKVVPLLVWGIMIVETVILIGLLIK